MILILILWGVYLLGPIFTGEWTGFLRSIESVFLVEAQFIKDYFPQIWWYPFWYFGLPFYLVYQPIPIFLTALFSGIASISVSQAYRWLTGFFLLGGSVGLYQWAKELTKNKWAGWIAGLAWLSLPSVAYLFLSSDWRSFGLLPLRVVNALVYGEGPHMWGLALIPWAGLFLQRCLKQSGKKSNWAWLVGLTTLILLISLTAFVGWLVVWLVLLWMESPKKKFEEKVKASFLAGGVVLGLAFFWYNPAFLRAAFDYSSGDGGGIFSGAWGNVVFLMIGGVTFFR